MEPFGPRRDEERAGVIAAMIANANRDAKKRPDPYTPGDFFPSIAPEPEAPAAKLRRLFGLDPVSD